MPSPSEETPDMVEQPPKMVKKAYELDNTLVDATEEDEVVSDGEKKIAPPLATIAEVLSFAETTRTKVYIGLGLFFSVISGLTLPGSLYYFSSVFSEISAIGEEGLEPILGIVYTMMVLGFISLVSETLQCK
jgi:hypothetical protein